MTLDELRAKWESAKEIIVREKKKRAQVFPAGHPKREQKLAEMDELMNTLAWMKDALKPHCEPTYEQPALLDVPRKAEYN